MRNNKHIDALYEHMSQTDLVRRLSALGVNITAQAVNNWRRDGFVPANRALWEEAACEGFRTAEQLCPGIAPADAVLRKAKKVW